MATKFTKHYLLPVYFITLLIFTGACKEEDQQILADTTPVPVETERLLLASSQLPKITEIEYNADKTLKKYKNGSQDQVEILYASDSVVYITKREKWSGRSVYRLENHQVTSMTGYVNDKGVEVENFTIAYQYDNGKLRKEIASHDGIIFSHADYFYDSVNENLLSTEVYGDSGVLQNKVIFEYTNIPNKSMYVNEWNSVSMNGLLFPKRSKHLAKSYTSYDYVNDATITGSFTYELDQLGYVKSVKRSDDNGVQRAWTNTWE